MKRYRKINEHYIEEGEEFLIKDILPEHYIDENIGKDKLETGYAIRFLQNGLKYILSSFINGGFSYRGYVLYPFVKGVSEDNITRIKRLRNIAIFLNNNGYDFSNSLRKCNGKINIRDFAVMLSALYHDLSLIKNKDVMLISKPKCSELDVKSYKKDDLEYLEPLNELKSYANSNLRQYLTGFYLHGSLATKDYIKGWSDVDTLSIVSIKTISNPEALLRLRDMIYRMRHFFYRIDPLQHHGSAIISEYDLGNYCQTYFPVEIFKYAKSFFKEDKISRLKARDFSSEAINNLFWFVSYFRKLKIEKRFSLGSYDSKTLLHSITLFPAMYLQSKGILVYKKFSFGIAKNDFKKSDWEVIERVSSIRSNWKHSGAMPFLSLCSKINPLFYYQLNSVALDLFKGVNRNNKTDVENIVNGIYELSEEAWSNVKKNAKR
ncbi:hypothetical protein HYY71_06765 [Candidatus Woesearchaeota archaeon]|nr:hypothetical protein [Candidatus Woesearchaeota archaeon]